MRVNGVFTPPELQTLALPMPSDGAGTVCVTDEHLAVAGARDSMRLSIVGVMLGLLGGIEVGVDIGLGRAASVLGILVVVLVCLAYGDRWRTPITRAIRWRSVRSVRLADGELRVVFSRFWIDGSLHFRPAHDAEARALVDAIRHRIDASRATARRVGSSGRAP